MVTSPGGREGLGPNLRPESRPLPIPRHAAAFGHRGAAFGSPAGPRG